MDIINEATGVSLGLILAVISLVLGAAGWLTAMFIRQGRHGVRLSQVEQASLQLTEQLGAMKDAQAQFRKEIRDEIEKSRRENSDNNTKLQVALEGIATKVDLMVQDKIRVDK